MSKTQQKRVSFLAVRKLGFEKSRQVFKTFMVSEKRADCFWEEKKKTKQYFHFCHNLPRCQSGSVGIKFRIGV